MGHNSGAPEFITVSTDELSCELISYFLHGAFPQAIFSSRKSLPTCNDPAKEGLATSRLPFCLIDCNGLAPAEIEQRLAAEGKNNHARLVNLALFNVEPQLNLSAIVKRFKVRGLFYRTDPPEIFCKGIRAILADELWLSRKMLSECILMPKRPNPNDGEAAKLPSRREKAILSLISSGASNQEIASALSISVHTVKTHISNIYKKFNIKNRIQASLILTQTVE